MVVLKLLFVKFISFFNNEQIYYECSNFTYSFKSEKLKGINKKCACFDEKE